jgi:hypothetical protein
MQQCVLFSTAEVQNILYCLHFLGCLNIVISLAQTDQLHTQEILRHCHQHIYTTRLSLFIKIQFMPHTEYHVNTVFSVRYKHITDNVNNVTKTEKVAM